MDSRLDMKEAPFQLSHLRNIAHLVERMVAILEEVFVSTFIHFSFTVLCTAQIPNTFDIVGNGINYGHFAHTAALAVW